MFLIAGSIAAFLGFMSTLVWAIGGTPYSAMAWANDAQPIAGLVVGTVGVLLAVLSRTEWRVTGR